MIAKDKAALEKAKAVEAANKDKVQSLSLMQKDTLRSIMTASITAK